MKRIELIVFTSMAGLMTACAPAGGARTSNAIALEQTKVCEVSDWHHDVVKKACEPGQKIAFLPNSWGNEQLPIIFAAVNCDMRYSIAMTNGGVTCIYTPIAGDKDSGDERSKSDTKESS